MAIKKRPPVQTPTNINADIDKYIAAAPDATIPPVPERKTLMRGKREQISHTIAPTLLARLDAQVKATGNTRAALINLAISDYLESKNK